MVMLWDLLQTECLPGLVCSWTKWDGRHPPLSQGEEVSSDFEWRTSVQRWGQKKICGVRLRVLNGTWVEEAEVNAQECATSCGCAMDWCSFCISALFCGCQMDSHAHVISHASHYAVLTIMVFASWRESARPIWTMSVITLFGPIMFPVTILVAVLLTRTCSHLCPCARWSVVYVLCPGAWWSVVYVPFLSCAQ